MKENFFGDFRFSLRGRLRAKKIAGKNRNNDQYKLSLPVV